MKKTIITLFALASVTTAEVAPSSVWSYNNYDLTQYGKIDLTTLDLSTAKGEAGYTLMITFSENISWSDAGSILWLSSVGANESGNYTNSTGTLGIKFGGNGTGLAIFNAANGSSETNKVEWNGLNEQQKDYTFSGLTVFMTAQAVTTGEGDEEVTKGVVTLYQASENGTLTLLSQNDGLVCADVKSMWLGNWANDGSKISSGTANMALYSGVLTNAQMTALIPEPATATLSLLALAGLAARRRRR